ncbi:MAG TPA: N-acetylmuramoyl-L-alanine amidase [Gemmatimonadales bacterium]|nr:N-acetylmuramoyl-L-alanine amidase [Gemmatimonadales bacterium]
MGGALPPVPVVRGPLALRVMYPAAGAVVNARDSTFLFGSVGTGEAKLTIDGTPVPVHPNGAWLAWLPLAPDSVTPFRLEAWTASETTRVVRTVRPAGWRGPPPGPLWIDSTSLSPVGAMWLPRGEYVTLQARAAEGAELRLRLPGGSYITLSPVVHDEPVAEALRAFDRNPANLVTSMDRDRFAGLLRGRAIGPDPGPLFPVVPPAVPVAAGASVSCGPAGGCPPSSATADTTWPVLEAIRGPDTVRTRWPLRIAALDTLPLVAELDDDTAGTGTTDGLIVGRAVPGGTYQWFFPTGTRAPVSGRVGDELRLALAPGVDAWVSVAEARSAAGTPTGPAVVGSATLASSEDRVTARIPVGRRLPFQVVEEDRSLTVRFYGAVGNVNWIRYPPADSLVRRVRWAQEADQQVTLTFDLGRPVWGYRARWERDDLLLEIRRPPRLDESRPLKGRLIAVDPGHPPAGATGPTGLREAEANLGIALELRRLLEDEGARVLMTRTTDVPLDLWPRLRMADSAGAELLISVHNNALPDGINPFANHGTSVFYNHPGSIPLARAIQAELVRSLGLRDLGIGRGDLALVRGTWMPSVLTEGLFMILPEQEAALRSAEGRRLYASGIAEGVRRFLRERARER